MINKNIARIGVVVTVVAALATARGLGAFNQIGEPAQLAKSLLELGPWGYAAFIVAYALLQPFGVPGTVFIFAAAFIWPWPIAFALSMTGTMAASVIGFSFARFVARDWISARIPERFKKYNDALARRAFATVFFLRLIFWMPPLLHAFFGISKVRASTHFWASLLGYILPLFLVSFFGKRMWDLMKRMPLSAWLALGAVVITIVLIAGLIGRRRRKHRSTSAL